MQSAFDPAQHRIQRVLCFAAHPDDIDFGAAGTIAKWTAAGITVSYCIMTDGDAGGFSGEHRSHIAELRRVEQTRAAGQVGVHTIHFLGEPDGFLKASQEVIGEIVRLMRQERPDVVLSMHPERNWERIQKSHPDHLACGEAVTQAVYPAVENPYAYPELEQAGLSAYRVPWLWFYGGPGSLENHAEDITDHVEDKVRALFFHASQHPDTARMETRVRAMLRDNARRAGLTESRSAEMFQVVAVNTEQTIAGF